MSEKGGRINLDALGEGEANKVDEGDEDDEDGENQGPDAAAALQVFTCLHACMVMMLMGVHVRRAAIAGCADTSMRLPWPPWCFPARFLPCSWVCLILWHGLSPGLGLGPCVYAAPSLLYCLPALTTPLAPRLVP